MDKLSRDGNKNTQYWLKDFGDIVTESQTMRKL